MRAERRYVESRDQRGPFERDRDRILYTSAFRRLVGVTQVVHAGEGHVFHNRLTHTLEVGQIAQRMAQALLQRQKAIAEQVGLDEEVCQAAAWAHDLGHPPFGHIGEEVLDALMLEAGVPDGFEGNAQSFRIVSRLAQRRVGFEGLNLCRATLDAILKYPRLRALPAESHAKFGAYTSEEADLQFARAGHPDGDGFKSAEAEVMDWADDIGYAIHDLEDFYRAGLIPLDRLLLQGAELDRFLGRVFASWGAGFPADHKESMKADFVALLDAIARRPLREPFDGGLEQRAALRSVTSLLIGRYISASNLPEEVAPLEQAFQLSEPAPGSRSVIINVRAQNELNMLKRLVWEYVIWNPRLASQQEGQKRIVRTLFQCLEESAASDGNLLPLGAREQLQRWQAEAAAPDHCLPARVAADTLCRMTEDEAFRLHQRLTGATPGSIMEIVVH